MSKVLVRYDALVAAGELRPDGVQREVAQRLDACAIALEQAPKRGSILWRTLRKRPDPVRGLYLYGGVGRGKSMLMDLFFSCVDMPAKRRVHFHEFMQEVHERLRVERSREVLDP